MLWTLEEGLLVLRASMKMAAAALAAGAVLTACGPIKMGAAAVMSSQRISSSTLAAGVSDLNQGYLRYKGKIALQYPVSQMPQQVLGWLVRFRVRDELAAADGIRVSPAQVQSAMAQIRAQAQSSSGISVNLAELAVGKAECLAAKRLDIRINPQYGRLNYAQYSIIPAPSTLSAAESSPAPAASPSATPQLKPAC